MRTPAVELTPVLATAANDGVRYELPFGLALEFHDVAGSVLTRSAFDELGLMLPELVQAAGRHATTCIAWPTLAEGVYRNDDGNWPELVCAPASFFEHNGVAGTPMLYVMSEKSAILTGSESREGLRQIRMAMRGGLARGPMAWRRDQRCWVASDASLRIGISGAHAGASTTYVYLDELQDRYAYDGDNRIEFTKAASAGNVPSRRPLQAMIRRLGRGAGMLGARFTPAPAGDAIVVLVLVRTTPITGYDNGLSPDMAGSVLQGLERVARGHAFTSLGPGRLDIAWAQEHDVDSSASGFMQLAERLVPLLSLAADAIDDDVTTAWRLQRESVTFANLFDWLDDCIATHPERGAVFGSAVADAALESLEADLGLRLPSAFRTMARRCDGGRFVELAAGEPEPDEADDERVDDHRAVCELLSLEQIRHHFAELAESRNAGAEPSTPWPCLPVARTIEGHELLVLDLSYGPLGVRVLDAFHELGPSGWGVLYNSYLEFLEDFVYRGGDVRAIARAAVPRQNVAAARPQNAMSLQALSREIRAWSEKANEVGAEIAAADRRLLWILWAEFFRYQVAQGGFAQLVFNADAGGMRNVEQMLEVTGAAIASRYFGQALDVCRASPQELNDFRSADFVSESGLKDSLHRISLAYFREGIDFEQQVAPYVSAASRNFQAMVPPDARRALLATKESFRAFAPDPKADYWALADRGDNERVYEMLRQQPLSLRSVASAELTSTGRLAPCTLLFATAWDTYSATALGRLRKASQAGVEPEFATFIVFIDTDREAVLQRARDAWYLSRSYVLDEGNEPRIGELVGRIPFCVDWSADGRVVRIVEGLSAAGSEGEGQQGADPKRRGA